MWYVTNYVICDLLCDMWLTMWYVTKMWYVTNCHQLSPPSTEPSSHGAHLLRRRQINQDKLFLQDLCLDNPEENWFKISDWFFSAKTRNQTSELTCADERPNIWRKIKAMIINILTEMLFNCGIKASDRLGLVPFSASFGLQSKWLIRQLMDFLKVSDWVASKEGCTMTGE